MLLHLIWAQGEGGSPWLVVSSDINNIIVLKDWLDFLSLQVSWTECLHPLKIHMLKPTCKRAKSLQSRPTLCDPMDSNPPDSSVHGVLQARILEWDAMPSSRRSSRLRRLNLCLLCLLRLLHCRRILYHWATREARWSPNPQWNSIWR